ncbi:tetratricopeptide repeat protein [Phenylobacterium sp.]|uniref:tetratricopeptide repeat protein n=1 Tax=Phenylobacterium sp. TaxID=1871053 RepID=UPI0035B46BFA
MSTRAVHQKSGPKDYLGSPISPADPQTLAAIDDFVGGFITYEPRALNVLAAADADAGSALANAYAGCLHMLGETMGSPAGAAGYLARAEAAPRANAREQGVVAFLRAWIADDVEAALAVGDEVVEACPTDLAMVKLCQYLNLNRGDFPAMLRITDKALPASSAVPQLHGMRAFAYEQCHLLADAEATAWEALHLEPKEPWAQHALAHVMLTQGRIEEGALLMADRSSGWDGLNSFMYTHNWWHLALFHLSQGRGEAVLDIYDRRCWTQDRTYSQDQIGAVSLLARLEFAGIDVGGRWTELGDYLATRAEDVVQPFLSLQYLHGLNRAGRPEAEVLMAAIERRAAEAPAHSRRAWAEAALPAAQGIMALQRGAHDVAIERMGAALPRLIEVGGSHAQRDLFEQIYLEAVLRAGRLADAQQILELRRRFDPDGAPLNSVLARVYDALGLPDLAARAATRAKRTLERHAY